MSRVLWMRLDLATIQPFWEMFPWLLNGYTTDELFTKENPSEDDECQQHWETVKKYVDDISAIDSSKEKLQYLKNELVKAQQARSQIIALSIPGFEDQIRELQMALTRFEELAEF